MSISSEDYSFDFEHQRDEVVTSARLIDATQGSMEEGSEEVVGEVGGAFIDGWDDDIGSEASDEDEFSGTRSRKRSRNEGNAEKKFRDLSMEQSYGDSMEESQLVSWRFDQNKIMVALRYMILIDDLPLETIDKPGFKYLMSVACPMFKMPSRRDMIIDIYEFYCDEKETLKSLIQKQNGRISITIDMWKTVQSINYMCLTAHFIDDDWKLQERILNFCPISAHKSEELGIGIQKCLVDWGIDKIFTITTDKASLNDEAIGYLKKKFDDWGTNILGGKYVHMKCIFHTVNLIVQDELKNEEDLIAISRIRGAIKYIQNSPARYRKFIECVWIEKLGTNKLLSLDVLTRWDSTYLMLEAALYLRRAFEYYENEDPGYKIELSKPPYDGVPLNCDWERVELLVKFLGPFYEFLLRISGCSIVTSNNVFHEISRVEMLLKEWSSSASSELRAKSKRTMERFEKCWGSIEKMNMILYFAVILDPRYKLEFVEYYFDALHDDASKLAVMKSKVKNDMHELFDTYKKLYGAPEIPALGISSSSSLDTFEFSLTEQFKKFKCERRNGHVKTELEKYLSEDYEIDNEVDVLEWWKLNSHRFPILSKIARDVFAVPVSTQSTFTTGEKVLDATWSTLPAKIVQAIICSQNWLHSESTPINMEQDLGGLEDLEKELTKLEINHTLVDV